MIQSVKNILVFLFIAWSSLYELNASGSNQNNPQTRYTIEFGEAWHNYAKGSHIRMDILFKNLKEVPVAVMQDIIVLNSSGEKVWDTRINLDLKSLQEYKVPFMVPVPETPGSYTLTIPKLSETLQERLPVFKFVVIEPHKSKKLSLITVVAPDWEQELTNFVEQWEIKASSVSFGQAVLCGKRTWQRLRDGDKEARQLIERALRRDMSVVFLDFGPAEVKDDSESRIELPFEVEVGFVKASTPELNFITDKNINGLNYDLPMDNFYSLNGYNGISVPPVDMKIEGKKVTVSNYVTTGKNPFRHPVLEVKPKSGKGKIILCQVITEGRLDEKLIAPKNKPELPANDPFAVQFVLNLISASVGEDLLK